MNLSNDTVPDARSDDVRSVAFSLTSMIFSNAIPPTFVDIEARVARASGINKKTERVRTLSQSTMGHTGNAKRPKAGF